MKKFSIIFGILGLILLSISCSDDSATNPSYKSVLKGEWFGYNYSATDTVNYTVILDEANGQITGSADLFGEITTYSGNMKITQSVSRKGTISGEFNKPSVRINFPIDTTYFFVGNLSQDSTKIIGKLELVNNITQDELKFDIELKKK